MARNNLTFSLPLQVIEKLENMAIGEESPALVAKRLLLSFIEGNEQPSITAPVPSANNDKELAELRDKIAALEGKLTRYILDDDSDSGEVVPVLAERVGALETLLEERWHSLTETNETVKEYSDVVIDRIIELEKKVEPIAIAHKERPPLAGIMERLAALEKQVDLRVTFLDLNPVRSAVTELQEHLNDFEKRDEIQKVWLDKAVKQLQAQVKAIEANGNALIDAANYLEEMEFLKAELQKQWERVCMEVIALKTRVGNIEADDNEITEPEPQQAKRRGRPRKESE